MSAHNNSILNSPMFNSTESVTVRYLDLFRRLSRSKLFYFLSTSKFMRAIISTCFLIFLLIDRTPFRFASHKHIKYILKCIVLGLVIIEVSAVMEEFHILYAIHTVIQYPSEIPANVNRIQYFDFKIRQLFDFASAFCAAMTVWMLSTTLYAVLTPLKFQAWDSYCARYLATFTSVFGAVLYTWYMCLYSAVSLGQTLLNQKSPSYYALIVGLTILLICVLLNRLNWKDRRGNDENRYQILVNDLVIWFFLKFSMVATVFGSLHYFFQSLAAQMPDLFDAFLYSKLFDFAKFLPLIFGIVLYYYAPPSITPPETSNTNGVNHPTVTSSVERRNQHFEGTAQMNNQKSTEVGDSVDLSSDNRSRLADAPVRFSVRKKRCADEDDVNLETISAHF